MVQIVRVLKRLPSYDVACVGVVTMSANKYQIMDTGSNAHDFFTMLASATLLFKRLTPLKESEQFRDFVELAMVSTQVFAHQQQPLIFSLRLMAGQIPLETIPGRKHASLSIWTG